MPFYKVEFNTTELIQPTDVTLTEGVVTTSTGETYYIIEATDPDAAITEANTATGLPSLQPLYTLDLAISFNTTVSEDGPDIVTAVQALKTRLQALLNGDGWQVAETDITITTNDITTVY